MTGSRLRSRRMSGFRKGIIRWSRRMHRISPRTITRRRIGQCSFSFMARRNAFRPQSLIFLTSCRDELTTSDYFIHPDSPSLRTSNIPQRVLDIGCSISATWIIKLALSRGWETTEFVGLDLAPVLAPLAYLPNEVSSRISFVQRNFLKGLPFLGGSFDYVRISNVGEGVPEDKWVDLLEEAILLLSKDGALISR